VWQIAALLRVSVSYIYKALIRRRRTGETAVRMPCGRPPRKLAGHEQALLTRLGAEPDATLAELRAVPYGHWKTTTFVAALRWAHCSLRHRWTDQRRMVPHLCREGARTDAAARNPCAAALRGFKISHVRVKRLVKTR